MPTTRACDVLVAGAGVAGVPAAVAAARAGADTVLLEAQDSPGGLGVSALHQALCGFYPNSPAPPRDTLNPGIQSEIAAMLGDRFHASRPARVGSVFVLPYRTADFAAVYKELIAVEKRLTFLPHYRIVTAQIGGDGISRVRADGPPGGLELLPRTVVDCTGSAAVASLVGACTTPQNAERQLCGYVVEFTGLGDLGAVPNVAVPYCLRAAADEGRLPRCLAYTTFAYSTASGAGVCKFSLPPGEPAPDRPRPPRLIMDAIACLRKNLAGFKDAEPARHSDGVLERDGPRLEGQRTLTEDDILREHRFEGPSVRAAWPIEFWGQETGPRYAYLPDDRPYYEVPLACTTSRAVPGLFAAGRCLSATPRALASARVMGTCIATGEMAGLEAARAAC